MRISLSLPQPSRENLSSVDSSKTSPGSAKRALFAQPSHKHGHIRREYAGEVHRGWAKRSQLFHLQEMLSESKEEWAREEFFPLIFSLLALSLLLPPTPTDRSRAKLDSHYTGKCLLSIWQMRVSAIYTSYLSSFSCSARVSRGSSSRGAQQFESDSRYSVSVYSLSATGDYSLFMYYATWYMYIYIALHY